MTSVAGARSVQSARVRPRVSYNVADVCPVTARPHTTRTAKTTTAAAAVTIADDDAVVQRTTPRRSVYAAAARGGGGSRRDNDGGGDGDDIVAFAEQPDRLLCDPANALCVYATFEYRFVMHDAKRRLQAERLIDRAMAVAQARYRDAAATFASLSAAEQRAHVMRDVPMMTVSSSSSMMTAAAGVANNNNSSSNKRSSSTSTYNYGNDEELYRVMRSEWPAVTTRSSSNDDDGDDGDDDDDGGAVAAAAAGAQVKVRLYIDMIASRKALREVPTQSKPHALGQHLYRYVYTHYRALVLHTCVGISDAKVKLTCRDVLFPYKQVALRNSGRSNSTNSRSGAARKSMSMMRMLHSGHGSNSISTSPAEVTSDAHTDSSGGVAVHARAATAALVRSHTTTTPSSLSATTRAASLTRTRCSSSGNSKAASLPFAYTRLPPINADLIDQTRMLFVQQRAVSLSELARVFADINAGTSSGSDSSSSSSSVGTSSLPPSPAYRSRSGAHHTRTPRNSSDNNNNSDSTSRHTSSLLLLSTAYAEHVSMLTEAALHSEFEMERQRSHYGNMIVCLLEVVTRLRESVRVTQTTTTSNDNDNNNDSSSSDNSGRRVCGYMRIGADEAAARVPASRARVQCRSDRLLKTMLRCMARLDLTSVERDVMTWLQTRHWTTARLRGDGSERDAVTLLTAGATRTSQHPQQQHPLTELSQLLQLWLLARAAHWTARQCVGIVHVLVQQRLFHHHTVLVTLTDTIVVQRRTLTQLSTLALFFDAMLRYQAYMMHAMRHVVHSDHTQTPQARVGEHAVCNERVYRAMTEQFVHLLRGNTDNGSTDNGNDDDEVSTTTAAATASSALSTLSPTSFLFLTRALALLRFFDAAVVTALLPSLADYLQQHPEQYYGPVMLLGRVENVQCDVAVLRVVLGNMIALLRSRGQRYDTTLSQHGRHDAAAAAAAAARRGVRGGRAAADGHDRLVEEDSNGGGDDDDDGDGDGAYALLSDDVAECSAHAVETTTTTAATTSATTRPFMLSLVDVHVCAVFVEALWRQYRCAATQLHATSQDDVGSSSSSTSAYTQAMLTRDMRCLLVLLLDDVQRGVRDVQSLYNDMSSATVERLLLLLLRVAGQLDIANNSSSSDKDTTPTAETRLVLHPFIVELVFAFTRHARRRVAVRALSSAVATGAVSGSTAADDDDADAHTATTALHAGEVTTYVYASSSKNNNNNTTAAFAKTRAATAAAAAAPTITPAWQATVRPLLRLLLHHGLLVRTHTRSRRRAADTLLVMPDDVVSCAPRVAAAVAGLSAEWQRRCQQQQQQQQRRYASHRHAALPSTRPLHDNDDSAHAIFSRFSAVMAAVEQGGVHRR